MTMKGILKRYSLSALSVAPTNSEHSHTISHGDSSRPKRVSFDGEEPARIYEADEWDRSPAEVTLKLTYKDVVELRELNVSLVRTGPLMMERTHSRRPTRQRTPIAPLRTTSEPPNTSRSDSITSEQPSSSDEESQYSPSVMPSSRISPSYQYQTFSSQALPPLLEEVSSPIVSPAPVDRRGRNHPASLSESYFTFHPVTTTGSPPGLPFRTPLLKGIASPGLPPPSPFLLSSPFPSQPLSPKQSSRSVSPIPVYLQTKTGPTSPRFKTQGTPDSPTPVIFPTLSRRNSVPDKLSGDDKEDREDKTDDSYSSTLHRDSPSPTWKPIGLGGLTANSSSPALVSSKDTTPAVPVTTRKSGRTLMGWELKRNSYGSGKLGFGLMRKGSSSA